MFIYAYYYGFQDEYNSIQDGFNLMPLTINDIALAMITVGRSGWPQTLDGGWQRMYEITSLISSILAYVDHSGPHLSMSDLYRDLESSEKLIASYRMGMALSKLASERVLGIQWLRHVKPLIKQNIVQKSDDSDVCPDLVGQDNQGRWHVVEAKGRTSRNMSSKTLQEAKHQVAQIDCVNNQLPSTRCASVATLGGTGFEVRFENVPNEGVLDLDIDFLQYLQEYYSPIRLMSLANQEVMRDYSVYESTDLPAYTITRVPGMRISIGVYSQLYKMISENNWQNVPLALAEINDRFDMQSRLLKMRNYSRDASSLSLPLNISTSLDGYIVIQDD